MSPALIWIILGILLILSELLATSIVAVFIGAAALVVGLLLNWGLIESTATQFVVFGIVSALLLVFARGRMKAWFVGYTADSSEHRANFQQDIGERVEVLSDFKNGLGKVKLNGVKWDAESADDLVKGEVAWVIHNEGIQLTVARNKHV